MQVSAGLHDAVALLTGKELPKPTEQGKDGPQRRAGHFGNAKGLLPLPEIFEFQPVS